jgi:aspartate aminotransferase
MKEPWMKPLSSLVSSIAPSVTAMMMQKGRDLARAGVEVINLAGGEPDFPTPPHIVAAANAAVAAGDTHYPPTFGTPELLDAIVAKLARENNVHVTPAQVMVTPGAKWALYAALAAVVDPGDEVMLLDPSWVSYAPMVELHRAIPVRVALQSDDNFALTPDLLRAHLSPRTKLIMVNSPNNPTGRVLSADEINALVHFAVENDLYVLSDEIYEHIVFAQHKHISLAAQPGMAERTITVNGFSKAYAMTGWRLGWLAAPPAIAKLARTYQTQSVTSAASFTMAAGVAALNGPQDCVHAMTAAYAERRRFMHDALKEIPGVECPPVEGAFYVFPRFTQTRLNSLELSSRLLDKALIATTPGVAFGAAGEGHVRFSIATHMHDLERTIDRLAEIVPTLA